MSEVPVTPVVVGVDGSTPALAAVRLAAQEAVLRGRPLRVVYAFAWPQFEVPGYADVHGAAETAVKQAVATAAAWAPRTSVSGQVEYGQPAAVLLRESSSAALVVLGCGDLAGRTCLPMDSVVLQVAARARCPVVVACPLQHATGPILVGVDGSPDSDAALDFATQEAAWQGVELIAVHVGKTPPGPPESDRHGYVGDWLLDKAMTACRKEHPSLVVHKRRIAGDPPRILVDESTTAQLVVVGARGARGHFRTLLGTASQALLNHAHSTVAIVHSVE
jgi:nucleotide-binding universal stress UspA family protein